MGQIEGGLPYRALMDLLGAAGKSYTLSDGVDGLITFNKLFDYDQHRYIMCAGSPGRDDMTKSQGPRPKGGIVPGHAYTVLEAKEAAGAQLVCLRNPWGRFEWDGDWSDGSPLWTEKMKAAFKPTFSSDDGEFWMSYHDFSRHFEECSVVFYSSKWVESRNVLTTTSSDICEIALEFEVEATSTGFITLLQQDEQMRCAPAYTKLAFALYGPLDASGHPTKELLRSHPWAVRELVEEIQEAKALQPGHYVVAVFNIERVAGREITVMIQLDEKGNADKKDAGTRERRVDSKLRQALMIASAVGKEAKQDSCGPIDTSGALLPDQSYVLAARSKKGRSAVAFDFTSSKGVRVADEDSRGAPMKVEATLEQSFFQFVVRFLVTGGGSSSISYSLSGVPQH